MKLFDRIGSHVILKPHCYCDKLFVFDTQKMKSTPIHFISNNKEINGTTNNTIVKKYLLKLTGQERNQIRQIWDKHTVFQLSRLVISYGLHCYTLYEPIANHKGRSNDFFIGYWKTRH